MSQLQATSKSRSEKLDSIKVGLINVYDEKKEGLNVLKLSNENVIVRGARHNHWFGTLKKGALDLTGSLDELQDEGLIDEAFGRVEGSLKNKRDETEANPLLPLLDETEEELSEPLNPFLPSFQKEKTEEKTKKNPFLPDLD